MSDTRTLVAEAIAATRIHPPTRYAWFGQLSPSPSARVARQLSARAARDHLVNQLTGQLYGDFYRRGRAEPNRWGVVGSAATREEFEAALSAANGGTGYLDPDWLVLAANPTELTITKGGLELVVSPTELAGAGAPDAGDRVAIRRPKELFDISPGFYLVSSDRPVQPSADRRVVRLYWNLRADGAVPFVAAATRLFNDTGLAFQLKVLNDPSAFSRCDAGVIYLTGDDYPKAADLIDAVHGQIANLLWPRTPVFTAELAPGLGMAEDPGTSESFGMHRCRLLADALVRAHESGWTDEAGVLATVEARFAENGIDLDAAHLSPTGMNSTPAAELVRVP